jgi:hypothetical protein
MDGHNNHHYTFSSLQTDFLDVPMFQNKRDLLANCPPHVCSNSLRNVLNCFCENYKYIYEVSSIMAVKIYVVAFGYYTAKPDRWSQIFWEKHVP